MFFLLLLKSVLACGQLSSVPGALQVAWVSPVRRQARYHQQVDVVRYTELQAYVSKNNPSTKQLLQHLGVKRKGIRRELQPERYKLVIFDVQSASMCRPMLDEEKGIVAGSDQSGSDKSSSSSPETEAP